MVYLLKIVIFHGELLNNQRVTPIFSWSQNATPATPQEKEDDTEDSGPALAGGYNRGDAVTASRDLRDLAVDWIYMDLMGFTMGFNGI